MCKGDLSDLSSRLPGSSKLLLNIYKLFLLLSVYNYNVDDLKQQTSLRYGRTFNVTWCNGWLQGEVDAGVPGHDLSRGQPGLVDVGGRGCLHQGQARSEAGDERIRTETEQTDRRTRRTGL